MTAIKQRHVDKAAPTTPKDLIKGTTIKKFIIKPTICEIKTNLGLDKSIIIIWDIGMLMILNDKPQIRMVRIEKAFS